jgi:UDP-N-acetylglucosamine 2-epimerase (non-hydrolysing)
MGKTFITLVVGARPNFMKIAPIIRELLLYSHVFRFRIVNTGQHRSNIMNELFFSELGIPHPDIVLNTASDSSLGQIAKIIEEFEKDCIKHKPDIVMVVGDVNSTLACAIASKKLNLKLVHIEAGLRSGDHQMPEEINRILTDSISDLFFVTEPSGVDNLILEGHKPSKIKYVGNVMIDNLFFQLQELNMQSETSFASNLLKNKLKNYLVLTLHRPSNVDDSDKFNGIVQSLNQIAKSLPIIFPVHPRTKKNIDKFNIKFNENIFLLEPLPYIEFLNLWKDADIVLTDSGGLQEETSALGIRCITIRENTERPITIEKGSNILAGTNKRKIIESFERVILEKPKNTSIDLWDGNSAKRIVQNLL